MAHKQPQQHKTRSRFRMSRAAKQTLSKIHKTVTCNADFSTYMTTSEHQWMLELCLPLSNLYHLVWTLHVFRVFD